jgi:V/A-type H+-transporting ATPase subunit I
MQKVTVLCLAKDKDRALAKLRDLGVLHVTPSRPPAGGDLEAARHRLDRAQSALGQLRRERGRTRRPPEAAAPPVATVIERAHALAQERSEIEQRLTQLEAERRAALPFGDFDPDQARALRAAGIWLRLYLLPARDELPEPPAGATLQVLGRDKDVAAAVLLGPEHATVPGREVPLPARSLARCEREIATLSERRDAIAAEVDDLAAARPLLAARVRALEDDVQLLEARAGMGDEGLLAWIAGFCPEDALPELQATAADGGWAVVVRPPEPDDLVPTRLEGPGWVRQLHTVLEVLGITPGYGEPDVSAIFLVFLVVFAGMLIGDAGYGLLVLAAVALARRKWPQAPPQPFRLLRTIGAATVVWGAITGTWFAIPTLPGFLDALRVEWLAGSDKALTTRHVMSLCFFLGALHLTIAHLWAAMRIGLRPPALAQLGWIATTWLMYFTAQTMVLREPFPPAVVPVAVVGVVAILLFMTPPRQLRTEWFNHVMLPLSLVSNFVDVVSYLRLFAVGTAGVAVASAFNVMAAKIGAEGGFSLVPAALVAVFGHTLNLMLCAMGVLVHGVRLNTLEFSAHLGMQWSGVPYKPLRQRTPAPAADQDR